MVSSDIKVYELFNTIDHVRDSLDEHGNYSDDIRYPDHLSGEHLDRIKRQVRQAVRTEDPMARLTLVKQAVADMDNPPPPRVTIEGGDPVSGMLNKNRDPVEVTKAMMGEGLGY